MKFQEKIQMINYIKLTVYKNLTQEQMKLWTDIVKKLSSTKLNSKVLCRRNSQCFFYKILLTDELSDTDLQFIVSAWDYYYNDDFEIETNTSDYLSDCDDIEIPDDIIDMIKNISGKHLHNRWVDKKVNDGWKYGIYFNKENKTHPALCNWDNLPIEFKKYPEITPKKALHYYINNRNLFS